MDITRTLLICYLSAILIVSALDGESEYSVRGSDWGEFEDAVDNTETNSEFNSDYFLDKYSHSGAIRFSNAGGDESTASDTANSGFLFRGASSGKGGASPTLRDMLKMIADITLRLDQAGKLSMHKKSEGASDLQSENDNWRNSRIFIKGLDFNDNWKRSKRVRLTEQNNDVGK
ncbi:uncharacterized protein LOC144433428 [Glandiceps talaboti]